MFLFTTDPRGGARAPLNDAARGGGVSSPVIEAIRYGASRTDTSFDYLVKTAQRESSLDPTAKAKTSSASGLFQFIEQTWLGIVKSEGDKHGLDAQAQVISERSGSFTVDDPKLKREILALRHDPKVASVMAGALAQKNRVTLAGSLGREPNAADLYVAHVMGAHGAQALIRAAHLAPGQSAAVQFPEAAAANRAIFFDRSGRARSVAEVYGVLAAGHAVSVAAPIRLLGGAQAADGRPASRLAGVTAAREAPAGLYGTEGRRGPVSEAVSKLWTTGARREPVRVVADVTRFFPRSMSDAAGAEQPAGQGEAIIAGNDKAVTLAEAVQPGLSSAGLPLPPRRPATLGARSGNRPTSSSMSEGLR